MRSESCVRYHPQSYECYDGPTCNLRLVEHHLVSALEKSFSTDDKMPDWLHVQTALQCFEADPGLLEKLKHSDKCHSFFSEVRPAMLCLAF